MQINLTRLTPKVKIRKTISITAFAIFTFGLIMMMLKSNRILYVRYIPDSLCYLLSAFSFLIFFSLEYKRLHRASAFQLSACGLLTAIYIYDQIIVGTPGFFSILITFLMIAFGSTLILLDTAHRQRILDIFTRFIEIIVALSIFGWLLLLIGVPLPSFKDNSDPYYQYTVYFIFNLNGEVGLKEFMRFAGPFLEPGHLGTMCTFLLYLQDFNLKKIGVWILLLGVVLSLSLAAYGLLVGTVLIILYNHRKYLSIIMTIACFILIGFAAVFYNDGDNPVNKAIVMRLAFDDNGEMVGNNRTSTAFDIAYDRFITTNDIWLGRGKEAFGEKENGSDNITIGCAGYKRYFFLRGIIGAAIVFAFLIFYLWKYRSKRALGFFIVYLVANFIRDYPTIPMWMYLYIMGISVIGRFHKAPRSYISMLIK